MTQSVIALLKNGNNHVISLTFAIVFDTYWFPFDDDFVPSRCADLGHGMVKQNIDVVLNLMIQILLKALSNW